MRTGNTWTGIGGPISARRTEEYRKLGLLVGGHDWRYMGKWSHASFCACGAYVGHSSNYGAWSPCPLVEQPFAQRMETA